MQSASVRLRNKGMQRKENHWVKSRDELEQIQFVNAGFQKKFHLVHFAINALHIIVNFVGTLENSMGLLKIPIVANAGR